MSRYFDVKLDEPLENVSAPKPLSARKKRAQNRRQIRDESRNLKRIAETAKHEPRKRPVDEKRVQFYSRGDGLQETKHIKTSYYRTKFENKEKRIEWATHQSTRAELLLTEDPGYFYQSYLCIYFICKTKIQMLSDFWLLNVVNEHRISNKQNC